jgi:hypothetical protein
MTNNNIRTIATVSAAARLAAVSVEERIGVVVRRDEYVRPAHRPATCPLIGTSDQNRVAFLIRFDSGLQDFKAVDQVIDAMSALCKEGDQVMVSIVDDANIGDTVRPLFNLDDATDVSADEIANGKVVRTAEYTDAYGHACVAKVVLAAKKMVCVEEIVA